MGYTHYFEFQSKDVPKARVLRWKTIQNHFLRIYNNERWNKIINLEDNVPEEYRFDETEIRFNGVGDNGHETFYLSRYKSLMTGFNFCKTARKNYDMPVTVLLILLKYHYQSGFHFGSDGVNSNEEYRKEHGLKQFDDDFYTALDIIKKHCDLDLVLTYNDDAIGVHKK